MSLVNDGLPRCWGPALATSVSATATLELKKGWVGQNAIGGKSHRFLFLSKDSSGQWPENGAHSVSKPKGLIYLHRTLQMSLEPCGFSQSGKTAHSGPSPEKCLSTCLTGACNGSHWGLHGMFLQRLVLQSTSGEHIRPRELLQAAQVRATAQSQLGLCLMMYVYIIKHNGAMTCPNSCTRTYRACIRRAFFELWYRSAQEWLVAHPSWSYLIHCQRAEELRCNGVIYLQAGQLRD